MVKKIAAVVVLAVGWLTVVTIAATNGVVSVTYGTWVTTVTVDPRLAAVADVLVTTAAVSVVAIVAIVTYWLPTLIAVATHHEQRNAIAVLNTTTGWLIVGWAVALVWVYIAPRHVVWDTDRRPGHVALG